jgi:calcium/calmodulin-dependent protein kinase I
VRQWARLSPLPRKIGLTPRFLQDKFYIVTQLATGGELFDRICEQGKFTEKDASQTIKQVLSAVDYLHKNDVVHRGMKYTPPTMIESSENPYRKIIRTNRELSWPDLKPENLLYVTRELESEIVLADFGIAKTLDSKEESLQTMAGSFGYAAPEVMDRKGHGKPVDMWSMGVITYTLLCGYSPFRSENLRDLLEECSSGSVVFHERYWKDVSGDAKDFILKLIVPEPEKRWSSEVRLERTGFGQNRQLTRHPPTASSWTHLAQRPERHRPRLASRAPPRPRGSCKAQARYPGRQP